MPTIDRLRRTLALLALSATTPFLVAAALPAQGLKVKEEKPGLLARAKVTAEGALATAQNAVPKGKLSDSEIEEEDGRLVFVFTFKTAGKRGEDEVLIDALTGKLVKSEHESPADEAREQAKERAKERKVPGATRKKPAPGH